MRQISKTVNKDSPTGVCSNLLRFDPKEDTLIFPKGDFLKLLSCVVTILPAQHHNTVF